MKNSINITSLLQNLLGLLLFLLPWQTIWITREKFVGGTKWEYSTLGFYATELILWLCAALFIILFIKKNKPKSADLKFKLGIDRISAIAALLFAIYAMLSSIWSIDKNAAFQHGLRIMEALILFFMLYLGPLKSNMAALWFIAGSLTQNALGIWQFITQSSFSSKWLGLAAHHVWEHGTSIVSGPLIGRWLRAYGAFTHPNILGGYLVISIIILQIHFSKIKNRSSKLSIIFLTSYLLQITGLFFTFSRSAWAAFAIWTAVFIIYEKTRTKKRAQSRQARSWSMAVYFYSFLLIVILTSIYFPIIKTRFTAESPTETRSAQERIIGYERAIQIIQKNILLGTGAGNYTHTLFKIKPDANQIWKFQPVHNIPLLILSELGIIGASLLLFTIISITACQLSIMKKRLNKNRRMVLILTISPLMPIMIFDHYLYSNYTGMLVFASFIALLFKHLNMETGRPHTLHK